MCRSRTPSACLPELSLGPSRHGIKLAVLQRAMRRPPPVAGIRPSGSGWRACGPAGAPAGPPDGVGDGQEDTSIDQQHSGIFPLTARLPWITLAPQESRNNGNRPGPRGSMGRQSSGPSIHSGYLHGCSPSVRAQRHCGAHLPSSSIGSGSPRETRSVSPDSTSIPRGRGQWWWRCGIDVRSLSGHLRIASRPRKRTMPSVGR